MTERVLASIWILLERAALCLDCEAVYELGETACPHCASRTRTTLARWLQERRAR